MSCLTCRVACRSRAASREFWPADRSRTKARPDGQRLTRLSRFGRQRRPPMSSLSRRTCCKCSRGAARLGPGHRPPEGLPRSDVLRIWLRRRVRPHLSLRFDCTRRRCGNCDLTTTTGIPGGQHPGPAEHTTVPSNSAVRAALRFRARPPYGRA